MKKIWNYGVVLGFLILITPYLVVRIVIEKIQGMG